jgi:hypothetical protein
MYTGTCYRLLISVSVAPIDTPNRHRGGGSFYFFPECGAGAQVGFWIFWPVTATLEILSRV